MLKEHKRKALPRLSGQVLVVGMSLGLAAVAWASQGGAATTSIDTDPAALANQAGTATHVDVPAKTRDMAPPTYPSSAFEQGLSGKVVLRVEVDAEGRTREVRVLSSTPAGVFDAASIAAAKKWTFEPARRDGKAVASALKIPMTFQMNETGPAQ